MTSHVNASARLPALIRCVNARPGPAGPHPARATAGNGNRLLWRLPVGVLATAAGMLTSGQASAHVKWFCAFDVAGQPRGLENVLCADLEGLSGFALVVLLAGCIMERTIIGDALLRALDRVTSGLRANTEVLFRATCGLFFVALWTLGNVLLTPELKTASTAVSWLQLAIAAGLIWRRTLPLSGLGIVVLFGLAVREYGVFHLLDYPIFLGVAAYLVLTGLQRTLFGMRPLDIVRWSASITLMWGSIEKWAYPQWTFPLFISHPAINMGYDGEFFMRAAGVVEFTLAFALLWTPLVRRSAAIMLGGIFVSAIFEFGKVDAIGHSAIIIVLMAIAADDARAKLDKRHPLLAPVGYGSALAGFLAAYYVAHAAMFGTAIL
jgi:hypothetical protein